MSICLVWCSTARYTISNIAAWLSIHSGIGLCMGKPVSSLIDLSQAACCLVLANSMYSASPTESVTVFCCCDAQDMHPFPIKKMCPEVECQSSLFSPQSKSEYLINLALELPSYFMWRSFVPLRYLNMCFTFLTCTSDGLLLNWDSCVAGNMMSGAYSSVDQCSNHLLELCLGLSGCCTIVLF